MGKIVGIMKFGISFVLFLFCVMTLFNLKLQDEWEWFAGALIISATFGIYVVYLINTGISNVTNNVYKLNITAMIGLLMHFAFMVALVLYSYLNLGLNITITSAIASAVGIAVGIFDLRRFLLSWNARKAAKR